MKYHVFVDFDGTVTVEDVGYNFFKKFAHGKAEPVVRKYHRGEIGAVECLQAECDIYNAYPAPSKEIKKYIKQQKICDGFTDFIEFCRKNEIKVTILSAGFDFYIKPILDDLGLKDLDLFMTPTVIKHGRIYPDFIWYDESVCPTCANCKGQRIKELTTPDEIPVFIGDGHSDNHGAEKAKLIFAKSYLADHLKKHGIDYIPYKDFFDIIEKFGSYLK